MAVLKLMKTSTLTINRPTASKTLTEDGDWVETAASTPFDIECSVQPYSGRTQNFLPDGYTTDDARTVFTDTRLNPTSQFTKLPPDLTTIDGLVYECFTSEDWTLYPLIPVNFECIFVRKDQAVGA